MPASVEKTYADALFSLVVEENKDYRFGFDLVVKQLSTVRDVITGLPEFVKLLNTPTIAADDKLALIEKAFKSTTCDNVYNFLRVLTVRGRMSHFNKIYSEFRLSYNELFNIAEITVTSSMPLTEAIREKIRVRMEQITGKTISMIEKTDKSIIGGVVVDYGNTRLDGSVKTRLAELKKDISNIIA